MNESILKDTNVDNMKKNISNFNISNVEEMKSIFENIKLDENNNWDLSNLDGMTKMFTPYIWLENAIKKDIFENSCLNEYGNFDESKLQGLDKEIFFINKDNETLHNLEIKVYELYTMLLDNKKTFYEFLKNIPLDKKEEFIKTYTNNQMENFIEITKTTKELFEFNKLNDLVNHKKDLNELQKSYIANKNTIDLDSDSNGISNKIATTISIGSLM